MLSDFAALTAFRNLESALDRVLLMCRSFEIDFSFRSGVWEFRRFVDIGGTPLLRVL